MEVKGLSKKLDKDKILSDFQETLLDFCESVIPNGSRRSDEWDCSDIYNSERAEGDQGSCSVNLASGVFYDNNPEANPQSGNSYTLFCAIFGLRGAAGWRAMRKWNEDRTLPDGSKGAASGRKVELSGGITIEAEDEWERKELRYIQGWQDATAWAVKYGKPQEGPHERVYDGNGVRMNDWYASDEEYIAEVRQRNGVRIAQAVSRIFTRRWIAASEATQSVREKLAGELAEMRGLSKEVFLWLIDNGYIACVYERKEIKRATPRDPNSDAAWLAWVENDRKDPVEEEPPPQEIGYFNLAFPVCRDLPPEEHGRPWSNWHTGSVQFYGMHMPWTDKDGNKHWRYMPKGCPAHPYIINDVASADLVVVAESTWDAIAYIDLRKLWTWTEYSWAVIATRGASNAQRLPAALIKEGAVVVRLLQNDAGNEAWVASLPLMTQAEHQEIRPPDGIKDLNDWVREAGAETVLQAIW